MPKLMLTTGTDVFSAGNNQLMILSGDLKNIDILKINGEESYQHWVIYRADPTTLLKRLLQIEDNILLLSGDYS